MMFSAADNMEILIVGAGPMGLFQANQCCALGPEMPDRGTRADQQILDVRWRKVEGYHPS